MAALCRRERRSALPSSVDSSHSRLDRRCPFARSRPSCPRRASRRVLDTHTARRSRAFSSRASASAMRNDTAGLRRLGSTRAAASRSVSRCTSWCQENRVLRRAADRFDLLARLGQLLPIGLELRLQGTELGPGRNLRPPTLCGPRFGRLRARHFPLMAQAPRRDLIRPRELGIRGGLVHPPRIGVSPLPISSARMAMHATIAEYRSCYQTPKEAFSPVQGRQDSNQPSNLDDEKSSTMSTHPPRTERLQHGSSEGSVEKP